MFEMTTIYSTHSLAIFGAVSHSVAVFEANEAELVFVHEVALVDEAEGGKVHTFS